MNANEFGKRLGIGVRVAGRIARQRAQDQAHDQAQVQARETARQSASPQGAGASSQPRLIPNPADVRQASQKAQRVSRAAGRGLGGFVRPFTRVGGILWLEVTGFFFGLFALFFAQALWRARLGYAAGPLHQRFLISAALTGVFCYLCASSFWRAKRK